MVGTPGSGRRHSRQEGSPLSRGRRRSTQGNSQVAPGRRGSAHSLHDGSPLSRHGSTEDGFSPVGRRGSTYSNTEHEGSPRRRGSSPNSKRGSSPTGGSSPPRGSSPTNKAVTKRESPLLTREDSRKFAERAVAGADPDSHAEPHSARQVRGLSHRRSFPNKVREVDLSAEAGNEDFRRTDAQAEARRNSFASSLEPGNFFTGTTDCGTVHEELVGAMDEDLYEAEPTKVSYTLAKYLKGLKPRDSNVKPGVVEDENIKKAVGWIIRAKDHLEFIRQLFCGCHHLFWSDPDCQCPPTLQSKLLLNNFIVDAGRFVGLEIQSPNDFQNYGALELTVALGAAKKRPIRFDSRSEDDNPEGLPRVQSGQTPGRVQSVSI